MAENNNEGYALKKSIIRKWIYEYGYTQKMIAYHIAERVRENQYIERAATRKDRRTNPASRRNNRISD